MIERLRCMGVTGESLADVSTAKPGRPGSGGVRETTGGAMLPSEELGQAKSEMAVTIRCMATSART